MKTRHTIYLDNETYEKLKTFSEKKKWSLTKAMEYILEKAVKEKPNAQKSNS